VTVNPLTNVNRWWAATHYARHSIVYIRPSSNGYRMKKHTPLQEFKTLTRDSVVCWRMEGGRGVSREGQSGHGALFGQAVGLARPAKHQQPNRTESVVTRRVFTNQNGQIVRWRRRLRPDSAGELTAHPRSP